jgi:hypothetical protein
VKSRAKIISPTKRNFFICRFVVVSIWYLIEQPACQLGEPKKDYGPTLLQTNGLRMFILAFLRFDDHFGLLGNSRPEKLRTCPNSIQSS